MMQPEHISSIISGTFLLHEADDAVIDNLAYDSRRVQQPISALFFALVTPHSDGHDFLADAYARGVRNFVVSEAPDPGLLQGSNVIKVQDTLDALQQLAASHRAQFSIPVIGITGSNGKTIVKEWLFHLMQDDHDIVRSPRSYNSQIGVPLSVWQMASHHSLAIFEAGISEPGEMEALHDIIRPTIGILTNIGAAHSEGFIDQSQKLEEKMKLFTGAEIVIARNKDIGNRRDLVHPPTQLMTWGSAEHNQFVTGTTVRDHERSTITITYQGQTLTYTIPFLDEASVDNSITCACLMLVMGCDHHIIQERMLSLRAVDMRLQLKRSFNDCLVVNDSYSADLTSLGVALDFLKQQSAGLRRTVILSDFAQSSRTDNGIYARIADLLLTNGISRVIAIGEHIGNALEGLLPEQVQFSRYAGTAAFESGFRSSQFQQEIILIKGARKFEFERIARLFEKKQHQTVLEINLNALAHNLKSYQRLLHPDTKVMAMVKAFSYGSGGAEIASILQYHHVHYLGVAYADEGVELVKAGITIPIMVMNPEPASFQSIVDFNLEPVIYDAEILNQFGAYLGTQGLMRFPVHLEIETGMNRLGFDFSEVPRLATMFASDERFLIKSVFTHLAASEDADQDDFTHQQAALFKKAVSILEKSVETPFLRHISNSAAIVRHPQLQMDMVRLGIGLYGVEIANEQLLDLQAVATLRSTIAQLKKVPAGASVSYNRKGVVTRNSTIATIRIGYADGYARAFGYGKGKILVRGELAPVIGTVCMDMTMIDVTDIPGVEEGDDVIIFGPDHPVQSVAASIGTIPYEIMTSVSQRVKRIYFHD